MKIPFVRAAVALVFALVATGVQGQQLNLQPAKTIPALGGGDLAVTVDGQGHVYLRLVTGQAVTLDYADVGALGDYLDQFQTFAAEVASGNDAKVDYPLGVQSLVPYLPGISKVWMQARSDGKTAAMGLRLVKYADHGGWGGDETVWVDPAAARTLRQALGQAVQDDQLLLGKLARLWKAAGHD